MLNYLAIGQKIRILRKMRNLSQEQLAEKIWISTTHMSHIETGSTKLSLPVLVDLANALEVSADEILCTELNVQKSTLSDSIQNILSRCTMQQTRVIADIVKATKESMDANM